MKLSFSETNHTFPDFLIQLPLLSNTILVYIFRCWVVEARTDGYPTALRSKRKLPSTSSSKSIFLSGIKIPCTQTRYISTDSPGNSHFPEADFSLPLSFLHPSAQPTKTREQSFRVCWSYLWRLH